METLKRFRRAILVLIDVVLIILSYLLAFYIRYTYALTKEHLLVLKENVIPIIAIYLVSLSAFKLYKSLWLYASIDEFLLAIGGCITGSIFSLFYGKFIGPRLPYSVYILAGIFSLILIVGFRISFRVYRRLLINIDNIDKSGFQNVMIIGAGFTASSVIKEMQIHKEMKYNPVVIIDDNESKIGHRINGVEVLGNRNDIVNLAELHNINIILIAIPTLVNKDKEVIINICNHTKCKLKIIPGIYDLIFDKSTISQIRDVDVEDLLGREPVKLDLDGIADYIKNKTVLVTGGGGSIGSELCRQIAKFYPRELLILDIYENNAYDLQNELKYKFPHLKLRVIIATTKDRKKMEQIFLEYKPYVVFHAAAHKHVPLMEDNPEEAIKNNVFGTLNVVECAHKFKTKRFVLISTDKAVNPTNVMGATKRIGEMIIQSIDKISDTEFVAVRFGNVLGSNGSVIPLFKKQIAYGGPVTVTHKEITRFFMTIPEAAQLVLQAGAYAKGGEIFILDMGKPIKIYDLACDLIKLSGLNPEKDIKIKITGLRPGEKLYEEVLMDEEGINKTCNEKIFIGNPIDIEYSEFKNNLKELNEIIDNCSLPDLMKKIREMVPTYIEFSYEETAVTIS